MTLHAKFLIFDFGGCIDSDGLHTRTIYYKAFEFCKLIGNTENSQFQDAYTFADQEMNSKSLVLGMNLRQMNDVMARLICEKLKISNWALISEKVTEAQNFYLKRNRPVIEKLSNDFSLGIVSNFSGNLLDILKEYKLDSYFKFVLDSYHVKLAKPDIQLFQMALELSGEKPEDCVFIGDNPERDIDPARSIDMQTVLIHEKGKKVISMADAQIDCFEKLLLLIQK